MALAPRSRSAEALKLHTGDRMPQKEFHRIYQRMPPDFQAELIGGIVYVASSLKRRHDTHHLPLGTLFYLYETHTPGVESGDNTTILLGEEAEPQPNLYLRILPEYGGQSGTTRDDFVQGAPELVAEVAHSSRAIDLHGKRDDYGRYGVQEYLVVCLRERELRWFDLAADQELRPGADGVFRMRRFPGLWIHGKALLARNGKRLLDVLMQGLASAEHAGFVDQLAAVGPKRSRKRRRT